MPRVIDYLLLQSIRHHRHIGSQPCLQMYTYAVPDSDDCHEHIIGFVSSGYTLLVSSVDVGACQTCGSPCTCSLFCVTPFIAASSDCASRECWLIGSGGLHVC